MPETSFDPIAHLRSIRTQTQQERTSIMERVRGTYFHHPMHDEALEFIDDLIGLIVQERNPKASSHAAMAHELQGFAIIGEPRAGKSTLLRKIFQKHPAFPGYGVIGSHCPLITIVPEGACTLPRFAIDALRKLGMPARSVPRDEKQLAHLVRDHMRLMGVKILHIDEAHHITQPANDIQMKKIINTFKCLMIDSEWPVALIFSGIPELNQALQLTDQLSGRFSFMRLPNLTIVGDSRKIQGIIRNLSSVAGLEMTEAHQAAIAARLIHASKYQLGRSIVYVQDAIENALKRRERRDEGDAEPVRLTPEDFARAYARKTGAEAGDNPFIVDDWESIRFRAPLDEEPYEDAQVKRKRGRQRGSSNKGN
ncbi:TniB family NTP-binding protein [Methylobacterium sp.]|uniref:TniB family NTP-binding protein n=1 Tax=Methylobacterium sp. TaxID=409 RepID=UPI003B0266FB